MTRCLLIAWAIAVHAASAAGAQEVPQLDGDREVAAIDGELFQLRDGRRFTVFLVTLEGVAIGDPLSIDTIDGSRSSGTVIIATSSLSASGRSD